MAQILSIIVFFNETFIPHEASEGRADSDPL